MIGYAFIQREYFNFLINPPHRVAVSMLTYVDKTNLCFLMNMSLPAYV